jgi:uncharacterized protein YdhG (YjbR/CyaY superfamily)
MKKPGASSVKPTSVAHYISLQPKAARAKLREMRALISAAAPGARQEIKWGMPAFSYDRILVMFGAFKRHIGFFPTTSAVKAFRKDLAGFGHSSATIRLPLDAPLPKTLIRRITKFRVMESRARDAKWRTASTRRR